MMSVEMYSFGFGEKKCITAILWTEITKLYYFSKMEDANDTVEIQTKKSIDYALL